MFPQEIINIENILSDFLGKSKNGISENGQVQYPCPRCIEEKGQQEEKKFNLEVNLYKMVFQCWSCSSVDDTMKGSLGKLIKMYGTAAHYKRYKEELISIKNSRLYDFGTYSGVTTDFKEEIIVLPQTYKKINLSHCPKNIKDYCDKRSIDQITINKFNIGYTSWDEDDYTWRNRIIIPSYSLFGDINFFVGRDVTGKSKMKYKNCNVNKKDIIFQESLIDTDSDILLVEGVIDALRIPNTISLLGKTLTKDSELYKFLYQKANAKIIICLDNDTQISETKKIYNLLNTGRLKNKIYYIRLNIYKDFGELYEKFGKKGVIKALKGTKQFNEIELVYE